MKPLFLQRKDGFFQWDIDDLTFLIGTTNEHIEHVALWVSPANELNYKMIDRKRFTGMNPSRILRLLKVSATSAVIERKVMGLFKFLEKAVMLQDDWDGEISELSINTLFTEMKRSIDENKS